MASRSALPVHMQAGPVNPAWEGKMRAGVGLLGGHGEALELDSRLWGATGVLGKGWKRKAGVGLLCLSLVAL